MKKFLYSIFNSIIITVIYVFLQVIVQFVYAFVIYFRNLDPEKSYAEALVPAISNINNNKDIFSLIAIILSFLIVYNIYCKGNKVNIKQDVKHISPFEYAVWCLFGIFLSFSFYLILFKCNLIGLKNNDNKIDLQYLLIGCLVVPVFEEWIFRNTIMKILFTGMNSVSAVIVQAVLFAAIHFNNLQRVYTLMLAIVLGFVIMLTKNIMVVTVIHMIFNIIGTGLFNCENMNTGLLMTLIIFSFVFCASVLVYKTIKVHSVKSS